MTNPIDAAVRQLAVVRDSDLRGAAQSHAANALLARILATETRPSRAPRYLLAAAAAAVVAGVLVFALAGTNREQTASAATVLRHTGAVARSQPRVVVQPGQFMYTRSKNVGMVTTVIDGQAFNALEPHVREIWLGPTGGRLHEFTGRPTFLTPQDRERWIALGRPEITVTGESENTLSPMPPLTLPTDPDALFVQLRKQAEGNGHGVDAEMFTLVGDSLRETSATPAQRAALYDVAARIPGVQLLGSVTDPAGRRGTAVALDNEQNRMRDTLVFDPDTSALLAERETALAGGIAPAGTVLGYAVYLQQGVVSSMQARPAR
jgi:hypothetical protein